MAAIPDHTTPPQAVQEQVLCMNNFKNLKLIFTISTLIFISGFFISRICIAQNKDSAESRYFGTENKILESKGKRGFFKKTITEYCSSHEKESFPLRGYIYDILTGEPVSNMRVSVALGKSYKMSFLANGPLYFFAKQWAPEPIGTKTIKSYRGITDSNGYFELNIYKKYIGEAESIEINFYPRRAGMSLDTYEIYKIDDNGVTVEAYLRRYELLFQNLYFHHYAQRRQILKDMGLTELYPLQDIMDKVLEKYGYRENTDEFFELSEKFLRKTYPK